MRKNLPESQKLRFCALSFPKLLATGLLLLGSLGAQAQLTGAKAIPGAAPTGYATLAAAVADLNTQGVGTGGVTFNLAPGYTETAANLLVTATGTAANPIVFQKGAGAGANPTLTAGAGTSATADALIVLQGSDYVTLDGLTLLDPATNATPTTQMEWGFALLKAATPAVDGCQNVVIRNCVVALQKTNTNAVGIYANNHAPGGTTQLVPTTAAGTNSGNKFYGNTISSVNTGIYVGGYVAPSPYALYDQGNEIGSVVSGTAATGNTVTDYGTTATAVGIYAAYQNGVKVQGNTVNSTPATGAGAPTGTLYGISVSTGGSADLLANTITLNTSATTSSCYGLLNDSGAKGLNGAAATVNIAGNSLTMTSATTTSASFYGLFNTSGVANLNITGNTFSNWSRVGTGTCYVLYVSGGATVSQNVTGNTISNLALSGSTGSTYCIYNSNTSPGNVVFADNSVTNVASGGGTVYGLYTYLGNNVDVLRNRIAGLSTTSTSAFLGLYGIYIGGGTRVNVTNNLVGDFTAPAGGSAGVAVAGIFLSSGTTVNAQFNSVYLNATSTAVNFGSSGIWYASSTATTVSLRNNVVVNTSTAAGTGLTTALRRSGGTAGVVPVNLSANNNLYYAGTPSATNLIYSEGINSTSPYANQFQTLAAYKNFIGGGQETSSVTENPPFLSTVGTNANFLKVSTTVPTQIESGGTPIAGITTDYAGNPRNATTPDLGAYEGTYLPLDISGPIITAATLGNTNSTTSRTVVVNITDPSGVATGANAPRLYYRKGTTGAFVFVNATSVSGSQYTFTLDYALLPGGSVAIGDVIQYYVAAQDLAATPNVSTSPSGGGGTTPPGTTAPATPGSFQIVGSLAGTYYVGTSPPPAGTPASNVFATLTAAASAYNLNVLTGATTFLLLDAAYGPAETFPITFNANALASATNTLLIRPAPGVSPVVTGSATATSLLLLRGASYLTLDGANAAGGITRNLTLTGTNAGASAVVLVGSLGLSAGATNNILRNLNLRGGSNSNASSFGILVSAVPTGAPNATIGADNDNLTVQNNSITGVFYGIYANGTGAVSAGGLDGLTITGNLIGPAVAAGSDNIGYHGLYLANALNPTITGNTVRNLRSAAASPYGLNFPTGVSGATVSQNTITSIQTTSGDAFGIGLGTNFINGVVDRNRIEAVVGSLTLANGGKGIDIATNNAVSNLRVSNNVVSGMNGSGWSNLPTNAIVGIRINSGSGITLVYNSVNLYGNYTVSSNSVYASAALFINSTATNLTVANNVLVNSLVNTGSRDNVAYSFYNRAPASAYTVLNNNDYFVSGLQGVLANVGGTGGVYIATDKTTLADLQAATTKDANSVSGDPVFASATDLQPTAALLNNAGTPLAGITTDFNGAPRSVTTPDIGAYEFTPAVVTATTTQQLNGRSLRLYPNPTADGGLTVELLGRPAGAAPLTVLNALGQVVYTGTTGTTGTARLGLAALAPGVYTVRVQTPEGTLTQRLVRQ